MRSLFFRAFSLTGLIASLLSPASTAQIGCADPVPVAVVSQPNRIEWGKFPAFTLPFTVVYGGPRFGDVQALPLQHGFSHIVQVQAVETGTLVKASQRAVEYSGFATTISQPWGDIRSPWNNDLTAYRQRWNQWLSDVAGKQTTPDGKFSFPASRLTVDIERVQTTNNQILSLKTNPAVPAQYRQLTDSEFIAAYQLAIRNLYGQGISYLRQRANLTNVSVTTYSDLPIRNTYLNVPTNTWADWSTNLSRVDYLTKDSTQQRVGGAFFDQLDVQTPSVYYYYDYPSGLAPDYLAYALFQVEANRAWSPKPVVPYVWLRYNDAANSYTFIRPFMAEATAIFLPMSGAAGLWLWEDFAVERSRTENYAVYESFVQGLYRLSRFADMFQPPYEVVIETPARDLMTRQLPVWRGLVKGSNILIAAHNPYATETSTTTLTVGYKTWQRTLTLTGREVLLCRYDLNAVTAVAPEPALSGLTASPNPAHTEVILGWKQTQPGPASISLTDAAGRLIRQWQGPAQTGSCQKIISVTGLSSGIYIGKIILGDQYQTIRLTVE